MKLIIGLMVMLLPILSYSQNETSKTPEVGDILNTSISFKRVINSKNSTIDLASLHGKLVILDFWSTLCSTCIKGFPHLDSLQKKYGDQIQILLIIKEAGEYVTETKIKTFLSNWKKTHSLDIPICIENNDSLKTVFPHTAIPHYIWIDQDGRLMAKTMSSFVTETNIEVAIEEYHRLLQKRNNKIRNHSVKNN